MNKRTRNVILTLELHIPDANTFTYYFLKRLYTSAITKFNKFYC